MIPQTFPLQQPAFDWADSQPNAAELRSVHTTIYSTYFCTDHLFVHNLYGSNAVFDIRRMHALSCRIFSVELGADGRRCFIVTTYAKFWQRYSGMLPQHRHYYEIIRQDWPCHLYFGALLVKVAHACNCIHLTLFL